MALAVEALPFGAAATHPVKNRWVAAAVEIDREEGGFMFSWRILVVVGNDCRVGGVSWIMVGGEIWNLDLRAMFWGS